MAKAQDQTNNQRVLASSGSYKALINAIDGIVWECDAETFGFSFVSEAAERILGYPARRWLEEPQFWVEHMHPADREWAPTYCVSATEACRDHTFEYRMIAADGRSVWLRDVVTVVTEDDKPVRLVGVMIDITKEKEAQEKLKQQEEERQGLLNAIPDAIVRISRDGVYLEVKAAEDDEFAGDVQRLSGQSLQDKLPAPLAEQWMHHVEQVLKTGKMQTFEYERTQRGEPCICEVRMVKVATEEVTAIVRDVTSRKRSEEALRQSEQRLAFAQSLAHIGSWEWEVESGELYWSDEMYRIYGLEPGNGIDFDAFIRHIHPEDRDRVQQLVGEALQAREAFDFHHRIIRASGEERLLHCQGDVMTDDEGQVVALFGTGMDVTENVQIRQEMKRLREAQRALERSEEQRRMALESADLGTWDYDLVTGTINWDGRCRAIFGVSTSDAIDYETVLGIMHPKDRERIERSVQEAVDPATPGAYEQAYRVVWPDGAVRWVVGRGQVYFEGEGAERQAVRFVGTVMDITEQKRAEEALRAAEEQLRLATGAAQIGTWDFNPLTGTLSWDECCKSLFGLSPEAEIDYNVFLQGLHPEDRASAHEVVQQALEPDGDGHYSIEYRTVGIEDGMERWIAAQGQTYFEGEEDDRQAVRFVGTVIDITERKQAEEALRESEERFRLATSAGRVGVWDWDIVTNNVTWSDMIYDIQGVDPQTFGRTVESFADLVHPDDRPFVLESIERALYEDAPYEIEFRSIRPDGETVWISTRAQVVRSTDDEPLRMFGTIVDITERKRAEEALRESEQLYRQLVGLLPVALYTCQAPSGTISFYNEHAAALWGRQPKTGDTDQRFCGSFRLWLPDGSPLPHEETPMAVALREGRSFRNEDVIIERPDGSRVHVLANVDPIRDAAGRIVGAINAFHDISALKQAEEVQARLAAIVEASDDAIVSKSLDGVIQSWNAGAERLFGYTAEEVVGKSIHLIIPEELWEEEEGILSRLRRGERIAHFETVRVTKEGRRLDISLTVSPITDEEGKVVGASKVARDVTARKRAEAALAAREAELELIAKTTPLILMRCGGDLRYRFANRAAASLFGLTPNEMVDRPLIDVMGEEAFAVIEPYVKQVLSGEAVEYESAIPYPAVGPRWVHVNYLPERDAHGTVTGWVASLVDITERKQAEEALHAAKERYRFLADTIPQQIWTARPDGQLDYVNQVVLDYFGRTFAQMIGEGWQNVLHPDDMERCTERWVHSLETGEPYEFEFRLCRSDGEYRWHLARALPQRDGDGHIVQWFGSNTDIHDRKKAQEGLRRQTQVLETVNWINASLAAELDLEKLVQTVTDAGTELSGAEFGAFFYNVIDDQGEALMLYSLSGAPREAFEHFPMPRNTDIFHPTFSGEGSVRIDDVMQDPRFGNNPPYNGMPEGHLPVHSYLAVPVIGRDGETIGGLFFGHSDVGVFTEEAEGIIKGIAQQAAIAIENARLFQDAQRELKVRRETEQALELAKESAEFANQAKSQFLANMSHELRTPLNAVIGYSELLEEKAKRKGYETFVPELEKIYGAGRQLLSLVNDVLDLSKIEAGRMELHLETFALRPLLEEVSGTLEPLIEKNGNAFAVDLPEDLGTMHADPTKVRQMLFNLLGNAAKFTEDGSVRMEVERLDALPDGTSEGDEATAAAEGEWIVFRVTDTGIGMTDEQQEYLFESFHRGEDESRQRYEGTGLGLAITWRLCQMMGGRIEVESERGVGTTFTIHIPAQVVMNEDVVAETREMLHGKSRTHAERALEEAAKAPERGAQQGEHGADDQEATVLVIDDDAHARDLMRQVLEQEGFVVVTASGGREGLALARKLRPVLITLDVLMPGFDGWDVLSRLKSESMLADIPVVMVTIEEDERRAYALGASEFLTKPVNRGRLAQVLRRICARPEECVVLVVDDDAATRDLVRQTLGRDGYTVVEAVNGKEALARLVQQPPEVIVLDLMMPGMDGFEVVEELRKHEEWCRIPVVVVTSKDLTLEDHRRLNGGVQSILQKGSYSREMLLHEVRERIVECIDVGHRKPT